ncbi:class I SAM-dependent methyltransferase [Roseovarius aestuarii]|uniref:Putative methyltransferase YcgJ n=1 Tax=Roseovarius aestuarii TaxID=475083 RepID=A0A1X7BU84_9RHOB|nr:class I SAM-dependent methyltransferase [Roseovarius aestuarii]SMC13168.1 putative methyltransferase YcgJ [Roseovarius aestuarii]
MSTRYDTIGLNYADLRKPDPRIGKIIAEALGPAKTVLNVGAGAGSYEPVDRQVTAIEPSDEMIKQRPVSAASVIQGYAEDLPFADNMFDASMAVLTVHHWNDQKKGLNEMRRVTRGRIVILTYDPSFRDFWLLDYIPELAALDDGKMPPMGEYERWLGPVEIAPVPIPHDCTDGFLSAYWRRPAAYLDPKVRAAMSSFWAVGDVSDGLGRLEADLASGIWAQQQSHLIGQDSRDCGYRLVTTL